MFPARTSICWYQSPTEFRFAVLHITAHCDESRPSPVLKSFSFRYRNRTRTRSLSALLPESRLSCVVSPPQRIDNDNDDDENDWDTDQSTISTGVPKSTLLKKISAILPGIRMHPCDAGYPGK